MAIAVRNSNIAYLNNVASASITFPTGSVAGDTCLIIIGHGFAVTVPSGWETIDNSAGSNSNGAAFIKALDSADITAGSVSVSFSGTYFGVASAISFVGTLGGYKTAIASRNSTGATTRALSTNSSPVAADYAVYFGYGRYNGTVTSSSGGALQTTSNANASGVLTGGLVGGGGGVVSTTFSFGVAPTSDYDIIVIISATVTSSARVSWIGLEALHIGNALGRVSWFGVEALHPGVAKARVSWMGVEVLRTVTGTSLASNDGFCSVIWQ